MPKPPLEHEVGLSSYPEPGHTWSNAVCRCSWAGPLRVSREQAVVDAAQHLWDPKRTHFGPDWHDKVGDERAQLYEQHRRLLE